MESTRWFRVCCSIIKFLWLLFNHFISQYQWIMTRNISIASVVYFVYHKMYPAIYWTATTITTTKLPSAIIYTAFKWTLHENDANLNSTTRSVHSKYFFYFFIYLLLSFGIEFIPFEIFFLGQTLNSIYVVFNQLHLFEYILLLIVCGSNEWARVLFTLNAHSNKALKYWSTMSIGTYEVKPLTCLLFATTHMHTSSAWKRMQTTFVNGKCGWFLLKRPQFF